VAVKIRLKRMGKIRAPHYRIVVADARTKRDGVTIEEIGVYNPKLEPSLIRVDAERVAHWLSVGAQPTESVQALLSKTGDWQKFKGEPAPPPLLEQPVKRGRRELFDEALAASHSELRTEAVTAKKAAAKTAEPKAEKSTEPKAEKSTEPKAEKSTEPKAEKSTEPKADKSTEPNAEKSTEPKARKAVEPSAASTDIPEPSLETADAPETADQPVETKADVAKADDAKADGA
jgi:small subunit ribosomal protein S16